MTDSPTMDDPAVIERDIRRTQEDMSRTVDRIGDQLTMRNLFNALLDKADQNHVDARMIVDGARRNPIALGLIAAGAIWLVSDKDSRFPTLKSGRKSEPSGTSMDDHDVHHRDYVSHMSAVEMRDGEDLRDYQRRRDIARANFMMVERRHEEDESSFRRRLDDMSEKFREKRRAWADSASESGTATRQKGQAALARIQALYDRNPLVAGIVVAAAGAALGSSLPISRQEQEKLGSVGAKARDLAEEQKDQIASQAREKKDELLQKADEKLHETEPAAPPTGGTTERESGESTRETPFMIKDRPR